MRQLVDRVILSGPLSRAARFRLDCNGAPIDGDTIICPAGTQVEETEGLIVLHFWDAEEPTVILTPDMVREVRLVPPLR
jgi:hypothetical protein